MAISVSRPSLADLFAPETQATVHGGQFLLESVLCSSDQRTLLWGRQGSLARCLLVERIDGISAKRAKAASAQGSALLALSHENLAQCIEVFREGHALYTIMVTGPGTTMAQMSDLSVACAIDYGVQICNALNYLHWRAQAHPGTIRCGAVSPDAVFITTHQRVRLTHMGELLGVDDADSAFAPPPCDVTCAEVFSVGATLHHALTGWQGMYRKGAPALSTLRPDCTPDLDAVFARALALDPAQRWPSSAELRYALLRLQK